MSNLSDDELLRELGVEYEIVKERSYTPREERIITGFEEIQQFVKRYGRVPQHGEDNDIFERLYAVRLDRLREQEECRALLASLDNQGLLSGVEIVQVDPVKSLDDDELLAELEGTVGPSDITELRHVRSRAEIRAAEEIANREKCEDFEHFRPLFEQTERELKSGIRQARPFGKDASVNTGDFFVLGGQLVYVAEKGDEFRVSNGHPDARLRVIYSNGTESNLLLRSLQRALYKDEAGRRLTDPDLGPLFSETWDEGDIESGTIYVLRSLSSHPFVSEHRQLIHKIGVTGGKVETRIANAAHDATYLLADVEVVASYKLAVINRTKLEGIFHRIFSPAQLDLTIHDRFGHPVRPQEWFLVPLHVIDEAVNRIRDGSITNVVYDPKTASLVSLAQ
ncbi:GIY-YIG nuclease family protein [Paenibacillus elgii]|uniref:GIY-YIG nuclease family protein n=1 Tax=Paenibacillus elgii TaxID=189691 RepID=UPI002D7B095A|nr:GIY-YIG nuclease family protein [Paenibacillus elgii]